MAEKIVLETEIKTGNSTASVKSVKAELRQLKAEMAGLEIGSAEFTKLAQRAGQLEDAIGDANAAVKAFNPEAKFQGIANVMGAVANGFSAAQGAIAMFGGESEELNKIMVQTQGAIALATGINGLMGMKDALGVLAIKIQTQVVAAFATMKSALISTGIGAFVVALGIAINEIIKYNEAIDEEANAQERLNEELKKSKDLMEGVATESERKRNATKGGLDDLKREKELLEAKGATEKEIFEKGQEIANAELRNLKIRKYSGLDVSKEIADKENEIKANQLAFEKSIEDKREDEAKKAADKRKALRQKEKEEEEKRFNDYLERLKRELEANTIVSSAKVENSKKEYEQIKTNTDAAVSEIDRLRDNAFKFVNDEKQSFTERKLVLDEYLKAGLISQKEYSNAVVKLAKEEENAKLNAIKAVSDSLTGFTALAGEQTAAGKALAVAQTTIDTYVSAVKAYKTALDVPVIGTALAPIAAASAVAAGLANVRRILSVQVPGGGGGGGSVPSAPNMSIPRMTATGNEVSGAGAISLSSQPNNKVYVVESDIRRVQNKVEVIENNARIG